MTHFITLNTCTGNLLSCHQGLEKGEDLAEGLRRYRRARSVFSDEIQEVLLKRQNDGETCFSKCGLQTSSLYIPREHGRKAESQPPPRTIDSESAS